MGFCTVSFHIDLLHGMNFTVILSHLVRPSRGLGRCVNMVSARSLVSLPSLLSPNS